MFTHSITESCIDTVKMSASGTLIVGLTTLYEVFFESVGNIWYSLPPANKIRCTESQEYAIDFGFNNVYL